MFDRLFLAHPRSVDESYWAHFRVASGVGLKMVGGGLACFVHAVLPSLHERTGSRTIRGLNAQLQGRTATQAELDGELTYDI
ncbi:DUF6356 family protein [Sphingomonas sp. SRS2]|uniref:DUF6356 family protein n=1 Tax=Sphingomonas sp. SRS2 TaxID=133190 RepID=UPI0006184BBB|nr:DUF6356 family protein [Sphingomonas sp. SRS2]KKC26667.1 hypothetical protein WP12_06880 [Sphingomonas sp. SRS2]